MSDTIPLYLRDKTLRAPACLFESVCLPMRVGLALALIFTPSFFSKRACQLLGAFLWLIAASLGHKWNVNPKSWKNYARPIVVYVVVGAVLMWMHSDAVTSICGQLLLIDALLGQQSKYIAKTYFVVQS